MGEPQLDLLLCRVDAIAPVDDIATNIDTEVATNGSGGRILATQPISEKILTIQSINQTRNQSDFRV